MMMPPGGAPLPPIDDEALSAYLDGALDAAEAARVRDTLRRDPALRARARETEATVALLRALPQPAPRRTFVLTPEVAAAVRPPRVTPFAWLSRLVPAMSAASAVAAVLLLVLFIGDLRTGGFQPASPKSAANTASRAASGGAAEAGTTAATARPPVAAAATSAPAATVAAGAATQPSFSGARAPDAPLPAATSAAGSAVAAAGAVALPTTAGGPPPAAQAPFGPTATGTARASVPTAAAANPAATAAPTNVAIARATTDAGAAAPSGGATVRAEAERPVPLALVRAGEIALLLLFLVALGLAVAGIQSRRRA